MSTALKAGKPAAATLADLIDQLGGIPPARIRLRPWPGTATEEDVVAVRDREDRLCELVDGVLVEKAVGFYESRLAVVIEFLLAKSANRADRPKGPSRKRKGNGR